MFRTQRLLSTVLAVHGVATTLAVCFVGASVWQLQHPPFRPCLLVSLRGHLRPRLSALASWATEATFYDSIVCSKSWMQTMPTMALKKGQHA